MPSLHHEQRPVILAFRTFIRNPLNRNSAGKRWTPKPLMEALWNLNEGASSDAKAFEDFCLTHQQTIDRLRSYKPKFVVEDQLLFSLIQKFLGVHDVRVLSPIIMQSLRSFSTHASVLFPPGLRLPDAEAEDQLLGMTIYTLKTRYDEGSVPVYLALRTFGGGKVCCEALVFKTAKQVVRVGLYFFSTRECYARTSQVKSPEFLRLTFSERMEATTAHRARSNFGRVAVHPSASDHSTYYYGSPATFTDAEAVNVTEINQFGLIEAPALTTWDCVAKRSIDPEARSFAVETFKKFDV